MKVAAVIPAYNEAKTIGKVIRVLKFSKLFSDIIVVIDGTDSTGSVARKAKADKVIQFPVRIGKGQAMSVGVAQTQAPIIFFADADILGFKKEHIKKILEPVISGQAVMSVGLRDKGALINPLMPYLPLIGGERAIRRDVFEAIPPFLKDGYMIEAALNTYCYRKGLHYERVFCPDLKLRQWLDKVGIFKGSPHYFEMGFGVLKGYLLAYYHLEIERFKSLKDLSKW